MGRPETLAAWLAAWLLLVVPALFVAPNAAAQIKTTETRWSFHLPLPSGVTGAESLAWGGSAAGWTTFAHSASYRKIPLCTAGVVPSEETESMAGRPLGLHYLGLMRVGPGGGEAEVLASSADGIPFHFVNGLDRDGRSGRVAVLKSGLPYPNGVAVSPDGAHVVVAHTVPSQVFRYTIRGAGAGRYELLADLPGYPDNCWVALNQEKQRLDATPATAPVKHLVGVRQDADGVQTEELTAAKGVTLSDVAERKGQLWLGSVELDYVGLVA
ncbi:hypothetical protein PVAP13_4NG112000 [Panicum virgatum]|uniref:Strictosidine synthase conserved region domain-containing protein n=1 Tax=Panicum virgatum TaxID=38727 RepID=A0A8T0T0A6_PANVG|nr:hypothetical protein PVAP13_4NG112000 [Panicum virgatum]